VPTEGEKKRAEENEARSKAKSAPLTEKPVLKSKSTKSKSDTKVAGHVAPKSKAKA